MPLSPDGKALMRANLEAVAARQKVHSVVVGELTPEQLAIINKDRLLDDMPPIVAEVLFVGGHVYRSRVIKDDYDIEDIIEEAESALSADSKVIYTPYMTAIQNPNPRADRLGNQVNDRAILECTKYRPNPELFSTQPKGDFIKPPKKLKGAANAAPPKNLSDSPG